jgi:hypothetical protein
MWFDESQLITLALQSLVFGRADKDAFRFEGEDGSIALNAVHDGQRDRASLR